VLMAGVTYFGMEKAAWVIITLGSIEVLALVAVIIIGLPSVGNFSLSVSSGSGVMSAAALVFFAFIGFDEVITLAEETHNPTRTVPRALILALGISTILYVGVAIATVSVLGADAVGSSQRPLSDVGRAVVGDWGGDALVVAALVSTGTTVLLAITAGSRMLYGIALADDLPRPLATVRFRRVPLNALILTVIVAVSFLFLGDLKTLAAATDALIYGIFMVVNVVLVVLRFRMPDYPRPFKVRGALGRVPIVPVVAFLVVVVVARELDVESLWLAGVVVVSGVLAHFAHRLAQRLAQRPTQ
jgi:APA family basic amino acid/polyamine antiporter